MTESSGYNNDSYMSGFEKGCISSNNNSPLTSFNSGYGSNNISDVSKNIVRRRKKKGESIRSAFELQHGDKKVGKSNDALEIFLMEEGKQICAYYYINISFKHVIFSISSSKNFLHVLFSYGTGKCLRHNAMTRSLFT